MSFINANGSYRDKPTLNPLKKTFLKLSYFKIYHKNYIALYVRSQNARARAVT